MGNTNYIDQLGYWLITSKEYKKLPMEGLNLAQASSLPGEYLYRIGGNDLFLLKLVPADGLSLEEINNNQQLEFSKLEALRENNNFNFAHQVMLYIFNQGVSLETVENLQGSKQVSALSRCYLLPWIVDLEQQRTTVHKGLPLGNFGLMGQGSPLEAPSKLAHDTGNLYDQATSVEENETEIRAKSRPTITYSIMAICVAMAGVSISLGAYTVYSADPVVMTQLGAKANDLVAAGQFWRLLSSVFLHLGLMHLAFNMVFLYSIGPGVESLFGKTRYFVIFVMAGLLGSIASFAFTTAISAGASGALFGLLGAYLYFWLREPKAGKQIGRAVVQLVAYNLLFGLLVKVVDNWAHLGGLLGGFLAAAIIGLPGEKRKMLGRVACALLFCALVLGGAWFGLSQENSPERVAASVQRQAAEARYLVLKKNDYAGAQQLLEQALKKQPDSMDVLYLLGVTHLAQNHLFEAKDNLEEAVRLKADWSQSQYYLGYTYAQLGRKTEALVHLSEAVKLDPENAEYLKALNIVKNGQPLP
ncbi:MAG TPA: rhomboid family intramembrane serine protease [Candidatus Deferrimicrobium sp.]|nr:rhomboid family intramembrane serine protease [Candidatus Deferrimicrobium sp.]